jgi:hypothetical protein
MEEISEQKLDKTYNPNFFDIVDLFTISEVESTNKEHMGSAFGGGL